MQELITHFVRRVEHELNLVVQWLTYDVIHDHLVMFLVMVILEKRRRRWKLTKFYFFLFRNSLQITYLTIQIGSECARCSGIFCWNEVNVHGKVAAVRVSQTFSQLLICWYTWINIASFAICLCLSKSVSLPFMERIITRLSLRVRFGGSWPPCSLRILSKYSTKRLCEGVSIPWKVVPFSQFVRRLPNFCNAVCKS